MKNDFIFQLQIVKVTLDDTEMDSFVFFLANKKICSKMHKEMLDLASFHNNRNRNMVPTPTGKQGIPGEMGEHFPVREKSANFNQTGKVRKV